MKNFILIERFYKLMKEENKNNYKYNPVLNSKRRFNLTSNKLLSDNAFIRRFGKIEKLNLTESKRNTEKYLSEKKDDSNKKRNIFKKLANKRINIRNINRHKNNNLKNKEMSYLDGNYCLKEYILYKKNRQKKPDNIKGFYTKSHCSFCHNKLIEKENNDKIEKEKEKIIIDLDNYYRNKNFKDIKSCFMYSVNNFPLIKKINLSYLKQELNDSEEKEKYFKAKTKRDKKIDMESELTKSNKVIRYKEIKRKEIDPTNLYLIKKPFVPSIRGKIFMNMRKRIEKPMRLIFLDDEN